MSGRVLIRDCVQVHLAVIVPLHADCVIPFVDRIGRVRLLRATVFFFTCSLSCADGARMRSLCGGSRPSRTECQLGIKGTALDDA